jgi:DNA topoisomerase-1
VEKTDDKKLKPTDIAFLVTEFLEKSFSSMMDYKFTAKMEENLDKIATGKLDWKKMLKSFW